MKTQKNKVNEFSFLSPEFSYFKQIFEQRSINGAARKTRKDAGNLSRSLARLEKASGRALFHRHQTGLNPTEEGEKLYRAIVGAQEQFLIQIGEDRNASAQVIKIGFSPTIGYSQFSSLILKDLVRMKIRPVFSVLSSVELIEKIKKRDLDLVLVASNPKLPGTISKRLSTERLMLCSSTGQAQKVLVTNPKMIGLERILPSLSYESRWDLEDYFVIAGFLEGNSSLMGIVPEGLLRSFPKLKIIHDNVGDGQITAITWPSSIGVSLLKQAAPKRVT